MLIGIFANSKISAESQSLYTNSDVDTHSDDTTQCLIPSKRWRNGSRPKVIIHFASLFLQRGFIYPGL